MPNALTFSTLACPDWSVEKVVAQAVAFGYDGLEWRGGPRGHINQAASPTQRLLLQRRVAEAGLMSLAVTAYSSFVSDDADERQANVLELNQYSELAAEIGARYVRAFLGELPAGQPVTDTITQNIADCLVAAATYAQRLGVVIALEPHDDFVRSASVVPILEKAPHPALRVIWDVGNTFAAGEDADEGFRALGERLAYVQIKDGTGRGPAWQLGPVGQGQVPLKQVFDLLKGAGYDGAFSVEWERAWHPELDPAEVALPQAIQTIQALLAAPQTQAA